MISEIFFLGVLIDTASLDSSLSKIKINWIIILKIELYYGIDKCEYRHMLEQPFLIPLRV